MTPVVFTLFLIFIGASAQRHCYRESLKGRNYSCDVNIDHLEMKIFCEEETLHFESSQWKSFAIFLFSRTMEHLLESSQLSLLKLISWPYVYDSSNFYTCNEVLKAHKNRDSLYLTSHCHTNYECFTFATEYLSDSFVTSIALNGQRFPQPQQDILMNFRNVVNISLRSNNMSTLPKNIFHRIRGLKSVDLSSNELSEITAEHFISSPNLSSLNLSHNSLEEISPNLFIRTPNLRIISFAHNMLKSLPYSVFRSAIQLKVLDLSGNDGLSLPEGMFSSTSNLQSLSLSECGIRKITREMFRDLPNLVSLDLSMNNIGVIPENAFQDLKAMKSLNLGYSKIFWLPGSFLQNMNSLENLILKGNELVSLAEETFTGNKYIKTLDISQNKLKIFYDKHIKDFKDLSVLDLSDNEIEYIELGIDGKMKVRNFNFSRNRVTTMNIKWGKLLYLENIDLEYNNLTHLDSPSCIKNRKQFTIFSFSHNQIETFNLSHILLAESRGVEGDASFFDCFYSGLPKNNILLEDNPLNCDCRLYDLYNYIKEEDQYIHYPQLLSNTKFRKLLSFTQSHRLKCDHPYEVAGRQIVSLTDSHFLCPIFEDCPSACHCAIRGKDKAILVNCSSTKLQTFPDYAPLNSTVLYFQNNSLKTLKALNLKVWGNLTELRLDTNLLETTDDWNLPQSLRILSLTNNHLKTLSVSFRQFVSSRKDFQLMMADNKWDCNCTAVSFKSWVEKHAPKIKDIEEVFCNSERMEKNISKLLPFYKIPDQNLCPESESFDVEAFSALISCVLVLIAFIIFYYRNKKLLMAFFYFRFSRLIPFCFYEDLEEDKLYDAFVAYSSHDRSVVLKIVEELENKEPYFKLCLHERDWLAGDFISHNIVYSVDNSRRTIIMLSERFVDSVWFSVEFRAAYYRMLEDRINRLLIILIGDLPPAHTMDDDFQHVLATHTYLKWGERWFWEKLRYALPHKNATSSLEQRTTHSHQFIHMVNLVEMTMEEVIPPFNKNINLQTD